MRKVTTIINHMTISFDIWCPFGSQLRWSTPRKVIRSWNYAADGQRIPHSYINIDLRRLRHYIFIFIFGMCVIDRRRRIPACVLAPYRFFFFSRSLTRLLVCIGAVSRFIGSFRFQCNVSYWVCARERERKRDKKAQCIHLLPLDTKLCNTLHHYRPPVHPTLIYQAKIFTTWLVSLTLARIQWLCKLHYIIRVNSVIHSMQEHMEIAFFTYLE